jgi:elongation factor Ts
MVKVTAQEVNALRKKTGAGMMDCKKALVEAGGDMDAAIDILRKKGQKVAAKRGDRDAKEGYATARINKDGNIGYVMSVNCETDFVAKNLDFQGFAEKIMDAIVNNDPKSIDEMNNLLIDDKMTIAEAVTNQTSVIGEKIEVGSFERIEGNSLAIYVHPGNQVVTIVATNKTNNEVAKDVAMQAAAMSPIALDEGSVSQDVLDKELEIGKELAIQEGKPEAMAENIAKGRLKKFLKENTLLNQMFIKDNKKSIKQYVSEAENGLEVTDFRRVSLK